MAKRNYVVVGKANKRSMMVQYSVVARTKDGAEEQKKKFHRIYPKAILRVVKKRRSK